ncbi:MAG TPA: DUF433 domain-containing protein [Pirellulales bacterium]|nr:DUF433 domain-containing protein [Pirellulales bacterium]
MSADLIHNRGRGPEIVGTRITVYNLLPYLLDGTVAETDIANLYGLTVDQVAAARAYVLNHADEVLARHREIEARLARGNPPELVEQLKNTHERLLKFKEWRARRDAADAAMAEAEQATGFPTFDAWLAGQSPRASEQH